MGLALMSEKARGRGEAGVLAGLHLASVGLQVGVDEFARDHGGQLMGRIARGRGTLTHSCT